MRVISGLYKGRILDGFDIDGTRPTQDRVKESLFGSIQDYIEDSVVLDLFAGSGNLGIEALSNGAKECYFVDNNKIAINTINNNLNKIGISSNLLNKDFKDALEYFKDNNIKFDLVFLDPPYKDDYIDYSINYLLDNNLLNDKSIVVAEFENNIKTDYELLTIKKEKKFGYKKIVIFKKI
jgi:16S rRNA (guanine(966)-N(2))-methyltransferase RsmD